MQYNNPVISTKNELLTSGFRTAARPTHDGADYVDAQRRERISDVEILAFADGTVVSVRFGNSVGWNVDILHSGGFLTRYMHMKTNSITVKKGDKVKQGQTIGIMGTTGESTGIHLHFGVKEGIKENDTDYKNDTYYMRGSYVNPEPYLRGDKSVMSIFSTSETFKINNKVKVKQGAKTYTGGSLASFVYNTVYEIAQITNDRAIIGIRDKVTNQINITAAMNIKDLIKT